MTKAVLFTLLFLVSGVKIFAQGSFIIRGTIVDTGLNASLENAIVTIMNSKDSILVNYARTGKDGSFSISHIAGGHYIIIISYPRYIDFAERFPLDSTHPLQDMGKVSLFPIAHLLTDIIINGRQSIMIKKDTIEYDAGKITIQPNARVEDILAQLPGIQIDKNGNITAQGRQVRKVLVDGEEFFGDDPTLVTRNIRGDMVDKIQVYDKKSDQASFNGIDDGKSIKTINIKLKENKKDGIFGKADIGVATGKYYQGQAMYNYFNGDQKFAAYGTIGNTGMIGLNGRDNNTYSPSNEIEIDNDNVSIGNKQPDKLEGGQYNGQGIPVVKSGGVHFDSKWDDKKESINVNYKVGDIGVTGSGNSITQSNLPTGIIKGFSNYQFNNSVFRQKLDAKYTTVFDSTSTLQASVYGIIRNGASKEGYQSTSLNDDSNLVNQSSREVNERIVGNTFSESLLWNKKIGKRGRTISIGESQTFNSDNQNQLLISQNKYLSYTGLLDSIQLTDQNKTSNIREALFHSNIVYTEPLTKHLILLLSYGINVNNGKSTPYSYNKAPTGYYTELDTPYSDNFKLNQLTNYVKSSLNYSENKDVVNFGICATDVDFKQIDIFRDSIIKRNFKDLNPSAHWTHMFSNQKSFRADYYGQTILPTISQVQPVQNNLDPLNIYVGNQNLNPVFKHSLSVTYNSFKALSGQFFSFSLDGSLIENGIINNIQTDSVGASTYTFENLNGHNALKYSGYVYYGGKVKSMDLQAGGSINYSENSFYNITNDEVNNMHSRSLSIIFNASKRKLKKYSIDLEAGPVFTSNVSSVQKELQDKGWGFKGLTSLTIFLPAKFQILTDANFEYSPANNVFNNSFERLIWNGRVLRKFLKNEDLSIGININDILDQNKGFNNEAAENVISQNYYTTIKRYLMVNVIWDFNKMKK